MVITLTPISKNQWSKVGKVFLWLALSFLIALVPSYLTNHYTWLATTPAVNFVLYTLSQIFQQDLTEAESELPASDQAQVGQVVSQVTSLEPASDLPTPATPVLPPTPSA